LETAYPKAKVVQNPNGLKPRKGSFEVSIDDEVLFSKLDLHGPAKNREHLMDAKSLIEALKKHFDEE